MIHISEVKLWELNMPLRAPFATAHGIYATRRTLVLRLTTTAGLSGYGECEAFEDPWYTEETVETEKHVLATQLVPLLRSRVWEAPSQFAEHAKTIKRHHFAKAGVEMALWDIYSQQRQQSIASLIGGAATTVDVGVVLGMQSDTKKIIEQIATYEQYGYKRYKIKVKPGHDEHVIAAIREHYPKLPLMVDANSAYTLSELDALKRLDQYELLMIEQPLGDSDFLQHAKLQAELKTPICLDESIHSYEDAKLAIALKSCQIINVKLGRVGGLTEAQRIHDLCREHDIRLWVGGMLESGIGRKHHIILASLPQFTIAGDISGSSKYFEHDIIVPEVVVHSGQTEVPSTVGLGADIDEEQLERYTRNSYYL